MIYTCPFCGRNLDKVFEDGITTCSNCGRVFHSSPYTRILAAAWYVRRHHFDDIEAVRSNFSLTDCEAKIVEKYVIENGYSHDELLEVVNCKTCIDQLNPN